MRSRLVSAIAAASLAAAIAQSVQAEERHQLNIPAMQLDAALLELAEQTDISIAFDFDSVQSVTSDAINGQFTPGEALDIILADTSFRAIPVSPGAWKIQPASPAEKPAREWRAPRPIHFVPKPDTFASIRSDELDKVIVISKRTESLAQIARSADIISANRLRTLDAVSTRDVAGELGTVQFSNVGPGRNKPYIRGISDGALAGRVQSTTGLYFKDIRLTYAAPDPDLRLTDVDSISVLSGPQGALYGAGSIGGIIRIQPNPVDLDATGFEIGAAIESTGDKSIGSSMDFVANIPIVENKLGLRFVAYDQQTGGWIDHEVPNIDDANSSRRAGGRLSLKWKLSQDTTIDLQAVSQGIKVEDSQYLIQDGGETFRPSVLEPHDNDFKLLSASIETPIPLGSLMSTTSLLSHRIYSRYDATGLFADLLPDASSPRPIDEDDKLFYITNESRLSSPANARIPWFAGVFLSQGHTDRDIYLHDGAIGIWKDIAYEEDRRDKITEYAVFGETIWNLGERITLTTGARAFAYDIKVQADSDVLANDVMQAFSGHLSEQGFAPDVRLKWQVTPQLMTYMSAAEGYRGPGFNTGGFADLTPPGQAQPNRIFNGDELWTYELGARFITPDAHLTLAATIFQNDWKNLQTDELLVNNFVFTGNAGSSSGYGAEFHIAFEPDRHWALRAHAILNEPEVIHPNPNFPIDADAVLPGATEWSSSFSATRRAHITFFDRSGDLTLALSGTFTGPSSLLFGAGTKIASQSILNMHANFEFDTWHFGVYAENLLDSADPTFSNGNPYQIRHWDMTTPLRPRTIGLRVSKSLP
ncbi:TonB-dependent receptor domain-containing protein [Hyphomonas sp.]|uniref:TonB-dependent receptor domain-containing protein n=1 Tax=Hyphomonas sp. TaxID=87 RepID=UPI0035278B41